MKRFYIAFIDGIKQPQWFSLISLLFILPFAAVMYYEISAVNEKIDFVNKEKMGVEYIQSIVRFLQDIQQYRGMTYAYLSGDTSFAESIKKMGAQLEDDIKAIDEVEKKYGEILKTTEKWSKIKAEWQKLVGKEWSMLTKESFNTLTEFIADILFLIFHTTNTSKLILDPYYDSYYIMGISTNTIPLLTEDLGKIRGFGTGAIASGTVTAYKKTEFLKLSYSINSAIDAIERGMQIIYEENPSLKPPLENSFNKVIVSTNTFLTGLKERVISLDHTNIRSEEYFSLATAAIDANFRLYDALTLNLKRLLQLRVERSYRIRYYVMGSLLFIFAVFFSVFNRFRCSLKRQIEADEQLKVSIHEKEVLLKELHHRVKNNLQVISSLFNIQSGYIKDKEHAIRVFEESQNRIRSMAIIHEKLYKTREISKINFPEYLNDLTANIFRSYSSISSGIRVKIKSDNILLNIDTAIPLGLIVNELVSNSIKYAFPDKGGGEILIEFHSDKEGSLLLFIGDNGIGLPEGLDIGNTESLGLQLVNTLVGQLKGIMDVNMEKGTEFRIRFNIGEAK